MTNFLKRKHSATFNSSSMFQRVQGAWHSFSTAFILEAKGRMQSLVPETAEPSYSAPWTGGGSERLRSGPQLRSTDVCSAPIKTKQSCHPRAPRASGTRRGAAQRRRPLGAIAANRPWSRQTSKANSNQDCDTSSLGGSNAFLTVGMW